MTFILWTLVWWGLIEVQWWRIYKYRSVEFIDKSPFITLLAIALQWFGFFYLYSHFIK